MLEFSGFPHSKYSQPLNHVPSITLGVSKTIYKAFNKSPTKLKQTQELD